MCCSTGVCGPSVDTELIALRDDLRWAEAQGAGVARHNLSSDPDAFVANAKVSGLMQAFGEKALPALLIDGEIALHGRYPTREELAALIASPGARRGGAGAPQAESSLRVRSGRLLMGLPALDALAPLDWGAWDTRYLFFTGKGGVGKTTTASAVALAPGRRR